LVENHLPDWHLADTPRASQTIGATALRIITLSTTTFSIMTLSIKGSCVILSISDSEHK